MELLNNSRSITITINKDALLHDSLRTTRSKSAKKITTPSRETRSKSRKQEQQQGGKKMTKKTAAKEAVSVASSEVLDLLQCGTLIVKDKNGKAAKKAAASSSKVEKN